MVSLYPGIGDILKGQSANMCRLLCVLWLCLVLIQGYHAPHPKIITHILSSSLTRSLQSPCISVGGVAVVYNPMAITCLGMLTCDLHVDCGVSDLEVKSNVAMVMCSPKVTQPNI